MTITKKILCSVAAVIGLITGGVTLYDDAFVRPVGPVVIKGQPLGTLRLSPRGLALIGKAEGCRRAPYTCPSGRVTNGIGNTHGVPEKPVNLEQIAKDWVNNLQAAERCVSLVEQRAGKPMSQGQFDALTSLVFNTGCPRFQRNRDHSVTQIYRLSLAGQYSQACQQLTRWVYGAGVKQPGLIARRAREYERCMAMD